LAYFFFADFFAGFFVGFLLPFLAAVLAFVEGLAISQMPREAPVE
jgi:hypothetical protein